MPVRYIQDDVRRLIHARIWDPVAAPSELFTIADHQAVEGTWRYSVVLDLRDLTQPASPDDIGQLVAHEGRLQHVHGRRGPVATVADVGSGGYEMARLYEALAGRVCLEVAAFTTIAQAEAWLSAR